jgi:hypothetical protein
VDEKAKQLDVLAAALNELENRKSTAPSTIVLAAVENLNHTIEWVVQNLRQQAEVVLFSAEAHDAFSEKADDLEELQRLLASNQSVADKTVDEAVDKAWDDAFEFVKKLMEDGNEFRGKTKKQTEFAEWFQESVENYAADQHKDGEYVGAAEANSLLRRVLERSDITEVSDVTEMAKKSLGEITQGSSWEDLVTSLVSVLALRRHLAEADTGDEEWKRTLFRKAQAALLAPKETTVWHLLNQSLVALKALRRRVNESTVEECDCLTMSPSGEDHWPSCPVVEKKRKSTETQSERDELALKIYVHSSNDTHEGDSGFSAKESYRHADLFLEERDWQQGSKKG